MWSRINGWFAARSDVGLLILRLWVGAAMLTHGMGKMLDLGGFVGKVGKTFPFPEVLGPFAAGAESIGAIMIAVGLLTRPAAIALCFTMIGAGLVVHWPDPFTKKELALTYAAASAMIAFAGSGKYSLDRLLFGRSWR